MSSLTITNNFTNSTTADAEEVDANFTDVKDFVDSHCVHKGETALEAKSGSPGNKFQFGLAVVNATNGQTETTTVVTFPTAFATTPRVVVTLQENPSNPIYSQVESVSTTQFTVRIGKIVGGTFGATTQYDHAWIAVGT
jgi:hypothetical protein